MNKSQPTNTKKKIKVYQFKYVVTTEREFTTVAENKSAAIAQYHQEIKGMAVDFVELKVFYEK